VARNFQWNPAKDLANLTNHGIAFEDAVRIFASPILEVESDRHDEKRMLAVGEIDGVAVSVAYTERENVTRIISARRASRKERKAYYRAYPPQE
jgi:uncharacterized protein